jgi:predicted unusual protein kinase regulating ubiquinone biosynthesis (AarF/ABC1/UbiB family)
VTDDDRPRADRVRSGRLGRLAALGGTAARLAGDAALSAGRLALSASGEAASRSLHARVGRTLAERLGELKGLPMKLGQVMSYIDDFVPADQRDAWRASMRALQSRAQPLDGATIGRLVEADLGAPLGELFERFDAEPCAAASIGQVHRAQLPAALGGHEVAVKVQYPGIREAIEADLRNVDGLVRALAAVVPKVAIEQSLRDVAGRVREECDYPRELANHQELERFWRGDGQVVIPPPCPARCGPRVLTTRWQDGLDFQAGCAQPDQALRDAWGRAIFRFAFRSMYVLGAFNGDPHPGNYVLLEGGRVAFLDHGCVQRYDRQTLAGFAAVRAAAARGLRGDALYAEACAAYGLPARVDAELRAAMADYLVLSFEPLLAPQPYRYGRDYTARLGRRTAEVKLLVGKKLLKSGIFDLDTPGAVFLLRINFGLNSVLADLGATADWPAEVDAIYREAGLDAGAAPAALGASAAAIDPSPPRP